MPDHLLALAPDPKTLEAGRRLFYSRRWRSLGGDGEWLWGEFELGKSKHLRSAAHLTQGSFYCSCRAHARPCAHNLALVLILKNNQDRLTVGQPPEWVRDVQHRATRPLRETKNVAAAGDRLAARLDLMDAGIDELELRLLDIARRGLADTQGQGSEPWLAAATRLTDAKLPGLAGRLRRLATLSQEGTEVDFARTLGDLYLFVRAWRHRDDLPPDRRDELYQIAGINSKRDELLRRAAVNDHWLVMGAVEGEEDRLRYRRVWLRGQQSRRYALLLDFAFGHQPFEQSWPLGASFDGGAHYYPGSYPQRALLPNPTPGGRPYDGLKGYENFEEMLGNYRRALAANPWLVQYPVYLAAVRPILRGGELLLMDAQDRAYPAGEADDGAYRLLATSGGGPLAVFAEFDGYRLRPLSLVSGRGLVAV